MLIKILMYILNLTKDCNTKDYSENEVRTFAISDEPDFTAPDQLYILTRKCTNFKKICSIRQILFVRRPTK